MTRPPPKPFNGLGCRIGHALLRRVERLADVAANLLRHRTQVPPARSDPYSWPDLIVHTNIPIIVYLSIGEHAATCG